MHGKKGTKFPELGPVHTPHPRCAVPGTSDVNVPSHDYNQHYFLLF